jgi:hypothetical protein
LPAAEPTDDSTAQSGPTKNSESRSAFVEADLAARSAARKGVKPVKEKRVATGDYAVGYCKTPEEHQFKFGNKGGPGRPSGSKSQNSILRAEFERKHVVREGGKTTKRRARDLISSLMVTGPITSRNYRDIARLNSLAQDLYPEKEPESGAVEANDPALDQLILTEFLASLQAGEDFAPRQDPFADVARGQLDLGQATSEDAWDEGDWDGVTQEGNDEGR